MDLGIPKITDLGRLLDVLNDRMRTIAAEIGVIRRLDEDLDAGGNRITKLGIPKGPGDALNLGFADSRYLKIGSGSAATPAAAVAAKETTTTTTKTVSSGGGTVVLSVPGTLAIESDVAPLVSFASAVSFKEVEVLLKHAPVDGDLKIRVLVDEEGVADVSVVDGETSATLTKDISVGERKLIQVDVLGVGITFPAADMTVLLRP